MSWFSRLRNWQTDAANGTGIRPDYHDSEDDNFASGINASLNIAGLNSPTSDIPWGTNKITGLKTGTLAADAATVAQVQTRTVAYAADSVGTDAYAITLSPALTAYAVGQQFVFAAGTTNTGAATLNINGLGAKTIKKDYNADLSDGDIAQNQIITVVYDGTNFQMQNPARGLISQTMTAIYAADGGGSDSYSITLVPAISSYATGQLINFKANTKNTGTASLNVNGLGAKTIKKDQGADLADGDIAANQIVQVIYDGTNFQKLSPVFGNVGQNGGSIYAADAGGTDAYAITLSPAPTAYTTGMVVRFKPNTANTGAATLNCNSLGAIAIKKFGSTNDVVTGDILAGQLVEVIYDGTNFQMISAVDDIANLSTDTSPDSSADYVKTYDASAAANKKVLLSSIKSIGSGVQIFTSSGTFNVPAGVAKIRVECYGGGGGGGGNGGSYTGGGGGGGGYSSDIQTVTPGQAITVTIGAGGAGSSTTAPGTAGGNTTFNGITANGGTGGTAASGSAAGGTGTGGTVNISGTAGETGYTSIRGGWGGSCQGQYGGRGGINGQVTQPTTGQNGDNYGAGGGGCYTGSSGNGANGLVVVWY